MNFLLGLTLGIVGTTAFFLRDLNPHFKRIQKSIDREKELKKIQQERESIGYGAYYNPMPYSKGKI